MDGFSEPSTLKSKSRKEPHSMEMTLEELADWQAWIEEHPEFCDEQQEVSEDE